MLLPRVMNSWICRSLFLQLSQLILHAAAVCGPLCNCRIMLVDLGDAVLPVALRFLLIGELPSDLRDDRDRGSAIAR